MRPPSIDKLTREAVKAVATWNQLYPEGQMVKVYPVLNKEEGTYATRTRSEAWLMGGHTAVVLIEGHSGGFALSNLKPLPGTSVVGEQPNLLDISHMEVAAHV